MMYLMVGASFISGLLFNLSKKNDKLIRMLVLSIFFIVMWVIHGWSYGAHDVMIGINRYNKYLEYSGFTEIGYTFIIALAHKMKMGYRTFFVLCSFFELLIMFWFVERNSKHHSISTWILFTLFPFVIYFQYIRNLAAFSFVLIGLDALLNKKKHYIKKYILFVFLGALIHISSLFFLLYLPVSFLSKKKAAIFVLILLFLFLFSFLSNLFFNIILKILGETKFDIVSKVNQASGSLGRILSELLFIFQFWVLYIYLRIKNVDLKDRYSDILFKINLIAFLFIPLTLFYGVGFSRMPILLLIVNYCFFTSKLASIKINNDKIIGYGIILLFVALMLIMNYRNKEFIDLVVAPFYEQNELINDFLGEM